MRRLVSNGTTRRISYEMCFRGLSRNSQDMLSKCEKNSIGLHIVSRFVKCVLSETKNSRQ